MGNKKPWFSKTLWTSAIVAVASLIPPVNALIVANPTIFSFALSGIFAALRVISKGELTFDD